MENKIVALVATDVVVRPRYGDGAGDFRSHERAAPGACRRRTTTCRRRVGRVGGIPRCAAHRVPASATRRGRLVEERVPRSAGRDTGIPRHRRDRRVVADPCGSGEAPERRRTDCPRHAGGPDVRGFPRGTAAASAGARARRSRLARVGTLVGGRLLARRRRATGGRTGRVWAECGPGPTGRPSDSRRCEAHSSDPLEPSAEPTARGYAARPLALRQAFAVPPEGPRHRRDDRSVHHRRNPHRDRARLRLSASPEWRDGRGGARATGAGRARVRREDRADCGYRTGGHDAKGHRAARDHAHAFRSHRVVSPPQERGTG